MAFNFPDAPTEGQIFSPAGGPTYVYKSPRWLASGTGTAQARNRIVNGAMQVSQENGNTAGTVNGFYGADQWQMFFVGTPVVTVQRVQVVTPNGSVNRLRWTISTADASLAAGDFLTIQTKLEGIRIADFKWGSAAARQVILSFGFKAPAGTYSIQLLNGGAANRSYIANFTIAAGAANTDTVQTFVIPGDVTGTWLTDTSLGLYLGVYLAAGSTSLGVAGWQAGNFSVTSANTNGMATAGAVFELYDVGLYCDPLASGTPPAWTMPDEAEELRACQRYYQQYYLVIPTGAAAVSTLFAVQVRTSSPAITGGGAGFTAGLPSNQTAQLYQTTMAAQTIKINARM